MDGTRDPPGAAIGARSRALLVGALLAGAFAASTADLGSGAGTLLCAASTLLAAAALCGRRRGLLLGLALGCLGGGRAATTRDEPSALLARLLDASEGLVAFEGRLLDSPVLDPRGGGSVPLALAAVGRGSARTVTRGRVLVRFEGDPGPLLRGDRVSLVGRLRRPAPPSNPVERDAFGPRRGRGLHGVLDAGEGPIRRLEAGSPLSPRRGADRVRNALARRADARLSPDARSLAKAILLGLRDPGAGDLLDLHARTGTLHFLAVSGVHALLVAGGIRALLRLARATPGVEILVLLGTLLGYAALTGFGPPVVRACSMLALLVAAPLLRRRVDPVGPFAFSASLGAILDPRAVAEASFQLSHAAALSIALFAPGIARSLGERRAPPEPLVPRAPILRLAAALVAKARRLLGISLAASLATTPLLFRHFGTIVPGSAPFSLLLAPIVTLLLPLGYAVLLAPQPIAGVLAALFEAVVRVEVFLLESLDRLPGTPWTPLDVSTASVLLACGAVLSLLARHLRLSGGLGIAALASQLSLARPEALRVAVFDVGHGTAVACVAPDRRAVLFDLGSADRTRLARSVLLPYLRASRVRRVEAVILSHPDADHWNGLPELFRALDPPLLVHRAGMLPPGLAPPPGTRAVGIETGSLGFDLGGVEFTVLAPEVGAGASENDRSLALRIDHAGRSLLLAGDPEDRGLHALSSGAGSTDVLLAPHHGLPAPGLARFLRRLSPRHILVSAGRRFDPGPTLRRWREEGRDVLVTRESGAIRVEVDRKGGLLVRPFRGGSDPKRAVTSRDPPP